MLASPDVTVLALLHAAMALQASSHTNALRELIVPEQERGPDFLQLASTVSALHPHSCRKKWVLDAVQPAVPRPAA